MKGEMGTTKDKIIAKELGSELMLYDPERDTVHILNATALLVYRLYREGRSLDEIVHETRKSFAMDQGEEILESIRECIEELRAKGLVARER